MYDTSMPALRKMIQEAEGFFKDYLEEHKSYSPKNAREHSKLTRALQKAGFDEDKMVYPLSLICATHFFPAERARTQIRKYLKENSGFNPDDDSDIGRLARHLNEEGFGHCRLDFYLKILKEESDGKKV